MSYQQYPAYGQQPPQQGYYGGQQYPPQGYYPPPGQYAQPGQYGQQPPPPQQGQYPPQQGPPQQGQYPPQQGPPQQGQYPPQQGSPQQGQYQPQQGPSQQGQYPPQQGPPQQGQYPPQQGYYQQPPPLPPQGQYYPPLSPGQYPPPQQPGYGGASPQPPYQSGYQAPPPQQPGYGYSQQQQQPPPYGAPVVAPTPASLGYGPPQIIDWDAKPSAEALRRAMKGFGTDENTLIRVLSQLDPLQVRATGKEYFDTYGRDLIKDIKSETSSWFEKGLVALAAGPLRHDCMLLHEAMNGPGTKEKILNDVLLGRSNADIQAIKSEYARLFEESLEGKVKGDLSMKTKRHFMMVLAANRAEDSAPAVPQDIDRDVTEIYKATEGRAGTDELLVCNILTRRNDAQIKAIDRQYKEKFNVSLESVIKKEFSGHMEDALLFQLRHACYRHMHRAALLEDAMSGVGTRDSLLVSRVVRFHWDAEELKHIKDAYQSMRGESLARRIKGETSGNYEKLMLSCIREWSC